MNHEQACTLIEVLQDKLDETNHNDTAGLIALEMAGSALSGEPVDDPVEAMAALAALLVTHEVEPEEMQAVHLGLLALGEIASRPSSMTETGMPSPTIQTYGLTGTIHWLRCDHPRCYTRWEGTSLEAVYDEHMDEYICPACGGSSAVRDLGSVPESTLKFAQITRDAFYDPSDRVWESVEQVMPIKDNLHRTIVHAALAAGDRLPVAVLLDYPDVIAALSETTGTYLDREPGWDVILAEVDEVRFALERAAHGEWPAPVTPSDFMVWFIDEADIQRDIAQDEHEAEAICAYLRRAESLDAIPAYAGTGRLAAQSVAPGQLPWMRR